MHLSTYPLTIYSSTVYNCIITGCQQMYQSAQVSYTAHETYTLVTASVTPTVLVN